MQEDCPSRTPVVDARSTPRWEVARAGRFYATLSLAVGTGSELQAADYLKATIRTIGIRC